MNRLLGAIVAALLAWCGVMQPIQAAVPTTAVVTSYAYDACHNAFVPTGTTPERGRPVESYRDIACPAVGYWQDGFVHFTRTATPIAYTYDAPPLAQSARATGTTRKQVQGEGCASSAFGASGVAAKGPIAVVDD